MIVPEYLQDEPDLQGFMSHLCVERICSKVNLFLEVPMPLEHFNCVMG